MFSRQERLELISMSVEHIPNVKVDSSDDLLASYAKNIGNCAIIKGLRAGSDFENEFQMALINNKINPELDTVFLSAESEYMYLSSSTVKELANYNADLSGFLPEKIIPIVKQRVADIRQGGEKKI
jgi:pantetheine-phosphate adenylyltransferase